MAKATTKKTVEVTLELNDDEAVGLYTLLYRFVDSGLLDTLNIRGIMTALKPEVHGRVPSSPRVNQIARALPW